MSRKSEALPRSPFRRFNSSLEVIRPALTFMKKALRRHGQPEKFTNDGLRSYRAAMNELGNADKREVGRWANNRA